MEWLRLAHSIFFGSRPEITSSEIGELVQKYTDTIYSIALLKTGSIKAAETLTTVIFKKAIKEVSDLADAETFQIFLFRLALHEADHYLALNPNIIRDSTEDIDLSHPVAEIPIVDEMPYEEMDEVHFSLGSLVSSLQQLEPMHQNGIIVSSVLGIPLDDKAQVLDVDRSTFLQLQFESFRALQRVVAPGLEPGAFAM